MAASLATGFIKTRPTLETPDIQFHVQPLSAENPGKGVNIARQIARHTPLADKILKEHRPDPGLPMDDDTKTLDWARNNTASIYHPTGTCKMGQGTGSVVDERLRVHGISGLRVADCSIMPEIVSGNTNAPAIMIGEKASDLILEDS
eukprot:snap_masked-scaffold1244_size53516-processed-gene-0.7 protein:Tk10404 transcript:snap_masked-scaffold1244_size53516-processed-gene-0.7-mRNA-1 annotation:"choline dehydrogenase"